MGEIEASPEDEFPERIGRDQQSVLLVSCYRDDRDLMMVEELKSVVPVLGQRVHVDTLVLRTRDQVASVTGREAALERQQTVGDLDAMSHSQVRQNPACGIGAVDDGDAGVTRVHEQTGRLGVGRRHKSYARDSASGDLQLELELQTAVVVGLQHVDGAVLRAGQ